MQCRPIWKRLDMLGATLVLAAALTIPAHAAEPIEGTWRTMINSEVTIRPCDDGYCGVVSKVVVPAGKISAEELAANKSSTGRMTDFHNKNPDLRSRPILGMQILALNPSDKPGIYDGEVYNPEDGNTYSGYIKVLGPENVRLEGCVLFNIICRGENWVRVHK